MVGIYNFNLAHVLSFPCRPTFINEYYLFNVYKIKLNKMAKAREMLLNAFIFAQVL